MKFTIERNELLKSLQLVIGVVERRQTLPILGNVLLSAKEKRLQLIGTDLEVELSGQAELLTLSAPGEVTVPAKKLYDICRALPEDSQIKCQLDQQKLLLEAGRSRFSLATLPAVDFPKVSEQLDGAKLTLKVIIFKQLIERTQFAMAQQDVRYYLNGSLWEMTNNTLTMVATDGHRLARCKAHLSDYKLQDDAVRIIVPRKAVLEIARLLDDTMDSVSINWSNNLIRIECADFVLTSKLIDGRYPDYQNVIPRGGINTMTIERDQLKPILARVAILSNEKYRGIRFILAKDLLKLTANNPEHEEAEEQVGVSYSGEPLEIALNVNYLIEVLNTVPKGNLVFTFSGAEKGVIIELENDRLDALNVVMPLRL